MAVTFFQRLSFDSKWIIYTNKYKISITTAGYSSEIYENEIAHSELKILAKIQKYNSV